MRFWFSILAWTRVRLREHGRKLDASRKNTVCLISHVINILLVTRLHNAVSRPLAMSAVQQ
jgi:hypothetical protein